MQVYIVVTALIYFYSVQTQAYNILIVLPYPGKSHFVAFQPFFKELAKRGHNVTLISHYPQEKPVKNLHDIPLPDIKQSFLNWVPVRSPTYFNIFAIGIGLVYTGASSCKTLLSNKGVQDLWKNHAKFDIVLAEQFNTDCPLGLAYTLGAPVVGLTSNSLMPQHYKRYGVPDNPSYTRNQVLGGRIKASLYERIERTLIGFYINYTIDYLCQFFDTYFMRQYIPNTPSIKELEKNIKFLLLYQHFVFNGALLLPSNVIQVGGHHVTEPKPLPQDLGMFMKESQHGVIYISFGSLLKASSIPNYKLKAILDVLEKLPQRIIWKWDNENVPFETDKIYSAPWLPQNDIMAHPNLVAFFSHCGQAGIIEAIHYGIPVIGIPMFGDQVSNAAAVEESGLGVQTTLDEITTENLLQKFKTILDPKFRQKVKTLSRMYRDMPISSLDTAVFWTEFAVRYPNSSFRSPILNVPLYQYYGLDILCVFLFSILLTCMLLRSILCFILSYISFKVKNMKQKYKRE